MGSPVNVDSPYTIWLEIPLGHSRTCQAYYPCPNTFWGGYDIGPRVNCVVLLITCPQEEEKTLSDEQEHLNLPPKSLSATSSRFALPLFVFTMEPAPTFSL